MRLLFLLSLFFAVACPATAFAVNAAKNEKPQQIIVAKKSKKRSTKKKRRRGRRRRKSGRRSHLNSSIETNTLGLIFGVLNAEYHTKFDEQSTIGAVTYLYGFGGDVQGFGVGGLYSYYVEKVLEGAYATAGGTFSSLKFGGLEASGVSLIGIGGYKWNFEDTYLLGAGAGLQYFAFAGDLDGFSAIGFSLLVNAGMYL